MDVWQILMTPFSWILKQFCILFDSYGIALILFTIVIKIILFPFSLKSKKSMIQMNLLSAKQREIQQRYPNDRAKQQEEVQKLYAENGVNPMGGCLWSLIPMFILFPLYAVIRRPFKYMMGLTDSVITKVATALGWSGEFATTGMNELTLASMMNEGNLAKATAAAGGASLFLINFNFLGIDLSQIPNWKFWQGGVTWSSFGLFLLPVISAILSLVSSIVMQKTNVMNKQQENPATQNKTMLIMMPVMSLWIGFTLPAGLCIYWIANSALSMVQELLCGRMLKKDYEEAQRKMAEQAAASKAAEKERRRIAAEKKAAALAEKKAGKKKAAPKKENDGPAINKDDSRVGMRAYARGRAYDPNRYPVTPYRDPNAKVEKTPEVTELTEEEKNILAEENPTLLEAATVETPVEETVAVETTAVEADTAASEETDAEGDYEAPYAEEEDDTKN